MKRRANREGSVFQRKDGRWVAYITRLDGTRKYKYATAQKPLIEWLNHERAELEKPFHGDAHRMTVEQYLTRWLDVATRSLAPTTANQYTGTIKRHVLPMLGDLKLTKLRPDQLQMFYVTLQDSGVGTETIHVIQAVLSKAFRQAVKWNLLASSPTSGVDLPGRTRKAIVEPLTLEQTQVLLAALHNHPLQALFALALNTGMRHAELLGLKWPDVDWRTGTVHVKRQYTDYGYVMVKTRGSERSIPLGPETLAILRRHYERQQFERRGCEILFPGRTEGQPISQSTVLTTLRQVLEEAGLPRIRFHDLRHTAATLMLTAGIHPKVVQERLGHTNIAMTLNTYSHVVPTMQVEAAAALDAMLTKPPQ